MEGKFFIPASERGEIEKALYAWAELALRRRDVPCLPIWEAWNIKNISAWANQVLAEAEEEERDMRPISHISLQKGVLSLHWEGTFTEGRKISLYLHESGDIEGNFKTGTGKPSWFLREFHYYSLRWPAVSCGVCPAGYSPESCPALAQDS